MTRVKALRVRGFRGIRSEFTLDLTSGGAPVSTIVYGANGTGKSSITDAWEWLRAERVDHLGREGAGQGSYPHAAGSGPTYVEAVFSDAALGTVRLTFDPDRATKPARSGPLTAFRALARHQCHIRYADLARFAYQTKAERYDALSQLMGFQPQVDLQKALRWVQHQLDLDTRASDSALTDKSREIRQVLPIPQLKEPEVLEALNTILRRHSLPTANGWQELRSASTAFRERVEQDPVAQRLSDLKAVGHALKHLGWNTNPTPLLIAHQHAAVPYKAQGSTLTQLFTIDLLRQGLDLVPDAPDTPCPLCGQVFLGNLHQHIQGELKVLADLQENYRRVELSRTDALEVMAAGRLSNPDFQEIEPRIAHETWFTSLTTVRAAMEQLGLLRNDLLSFLTIESRDVSVESLQLYKDRTRSFNAGYEAFRIGHTSLIQFLAATVRELERDPGRRSLVSDFQTVTLLLQLWPQFLKLSSRHRALTVVKSELTALADAFVGASIADVNARFALISDSVSTFFGILEADTEGISKPALRVESDQDRSVILEVLFHGQTITPAYKFLSESQLNSFGLAVFLASVRQFNPDFRFVLLDDVVNSFDAHKRPRVISLLREHFADHQILLMTHDSLWRDRLIRELPAWKRLHFRRLDYTTGPVVAGYRAPLERVSDLLDSDLPRDAGGFLGSYMEDELQDVCEAFEVEVKFTRRNDHTLDTLLDRLRVRARQKLGATHPLSVALDGLYVDSGFRNICAHTKNVESDLTTPELKVVLLKWRTVTAFTRCKVSTCAGVLRWRDPVFRCECGRSSLTAAST